MKLEALKKQTILIFSAKMFNINKPKTKIIHKKIIIIALKNQTFTFTKNHGFIKLMAHPQPKCIPYKK